MLAVVPSATLHGLDGRSIRVEVDVAPGLPGFTVVGLGDTAVQEARERVRGAIRNAGFAFPPRRLTVNLAPAELRKTGASLDLAIAIGILLGSEQVRAGSIAVALLGELGLDGEVRPVPGILPMVAAIAARRVPRVVVAPSAVEEGRLVDGIDVVGAADLAEAAELVRGRRPRRAPIAMPRVTITGAAPSDPPDLGRRPLLAVAAASVPDLSEVRGQAEARRGLEIALAGGHGLLLTGPPGVGKTLLARTIPRLLPPLDDAAALAVSIVASAAGEGPITSLRRDPPFRAPHHTLSYAAMVGGGPQLSPGEITRAHHGVLFLDELAEFDRDVLEALRQPLEEGRILVARAGRVMTFPARFQLIAAMNPCPCGFAGSMPEDRCRCTVGEVDRYSRRVSGPLRDRLDLWVSMPRVPAAALVGTAEPEDSATVAHRIAAARARAVLDRGRTNGRLRGRPLRRACRLSEAGARRVQELADAEFASGRGTERLLRVARTIADLSGSPTVEIAHLDEAAWYRSPMVRAAGALAS
ncbi:MAG TPA: YifB family Mg chelatase-like AAA ATPase [Candidatus Limnocylindrales bacterium]|jgi:magnesium chelatase family protein|nr:YifB family Mg chelatase-like AAA ATPase [Candidatus Limnocylindrales bacterium]